MDGGLRVATGGIDETRPAVRASYDGPLRRLAAGEPRTTLALGALLGVRRPRHDARVLTAGPADRTLCPFVRAELGVWIAYPLLDDADDAVPLAAALDRSAVMSLVGSPADVEPLAPHLARAMRMATNRRIAVPIVPPDWEAPTALTRLATRLDLEALYDLYTGYELPFVRTTRGMRAFLRRAVDDGATIVIDGDARLDGAMIAASRTPRYQQWSYLTVRPEARGQGYSWRLVARAAALNRAAGLGFLAVAGHGNPMSFPQGIGRIDDVAVLQLGPPRRVPGEDLVRRAWFKLDRSRPRRRFTPRAAGPEPSEGQ
jgi:GNAT superfamily N-acetyltransferase